MSDTAKLLRVEWRKAFWRSNYRHPGEWKCTRA